jgi:HEAT repeat protein
MKNGNELVNSNGNNSQPAPLTAVGKNRHSNWPLIILAGLFIVVPFLTWYATWFGRDLSDDDIAKYLADEKSPRHIQHALTQLETRIEKADPSTKKFYPQIVALTTSEHAEIRKTAAWVMGQDNTADEFHRALLKLLGDDEPLVRRNAALQLVRFGDASGRPEFRAMLQPYEVKSPIEGTIVSLLGAGSSIRAGALLARIRDTSSAVQEFRSPLDGQISSLQVKEGDSISIGQTICYLTPDQTTVQDSVRALAYVGTLEDIPLLKSVGEAASSAEIQQDTKVAMREIEARSPKY